MLAANLRVACGERPPTAGQRPPTPDDPARSAAEPTPFVEIATLVGFPESGWAALFPDGSYKLEGNPAGRLWWALGLARFEAGELDPYVPSIRRLPADAPIP